MAGSAFRIIRPSLLSCPIRAIVIDIVQASGRLTSGSHLRSEVGIKRNGRRKPLKMGCCQPAQLLLDRDRISTDQTDLLDGLSVLCIKAAANGKCSQNTTGPAPTLSSPL